jgi:hypothetical protein
MKMNLNEFEWIYVISYESIRIHINQINEFTAYIFLWIYMN